MLFSKTLWRFGVAGKFHLNRKNVLKITQLKVNNIEFKPTNVLPSDDKSDHSRIARIILKNILLRLRCYIHLIISFYCVKPPV